MSKIYNTIGLTYAATRIPDERLAKLFHDPLAGLQTVLNVGAGAGSYEPVNKALIALEPSSKMISQRPTEAAPCVCGSAENLPFPDNSFDAGMALLTIHHWRDIDRGLSELARVVRKRIIIHTWDSTATEQYWLINDYIPELLVLDAGRFPGIDELAVKFRSVRIFPVPIPHDCTDGFQGAYWRRPEAYLEDHVKKGISSFQQIDPKALAAGLAKLKTDLGSGLWHRRYGDLLGQREIDLGYRLLVAEI